MTKADCSQSCRSTVSEPRYSVCLLEQSWNQREQELSGHYWEAPFQLGHDVLSVGVNPISVTGELDEAIYFRLRHRSPLTRGELGADNGDEFSRLSDANFSALNCHSPPQLLCDASYNIFLVNQKRSAAKPARCCYGCRSKRAWRLLLHLVPELHGKDCSRCTDPVSSRQRRRYRD